jgi:hypothetical protein
MKELTLRSYGVRNLFFLDAKASIPAKTYLKGLGKLTAGPGKKKGS